MMCRSLSVLCACTFASSLLPSCACMCVDSCGCMCVGVCSVDKDGIEEGQVVVEPFQEAALFAAAVPSCTARALAAAVSQLCVRLCAHCQVIRGWLWVDECASCVTCACAGDAWVVECVPRVTCAWQHHATFVSCCLQRERSAHNTRTHNTR